MTIPLALADDVVAIWWVAIGVMLIVLVVVTLLLHVLLRTVQRVHDGVTEVWTAGKHVAQNTQAGHLLNTTKARGVELAEQLEPAGAPAERRDAWRER